ncbi:BB2324 family autotransporter [Bordetella bronchiseptica]|uniref:BB2324 family autotransporter n=1 Tax=Bordetella bronchiseptica TaxID=518 RepID=UPI00049FE18A|nr:BB2324 family autotransporter [Bordetella bronchiseptica]KDC78476.1 autotransporter beta-domain protein [Bordetella bronchiseptica MBORD632]
MKKQVVEYVRCGVPRLRPVMASLALAACHGLASAAPALPPATVGMGMHQLAVPMGTTFIPMAMSSDATVLAGTGSVPGLGPHAAMWPLSNPFPYYVIAGDRSSFHALSQDGSVGVGVVVSGGLSQAVRWDNGSWFQPLGVGTDGATQSYASGVSADGSVVVGWLTWDGAGERRPFRWTQATGVQTLSGFESYSFALASGISADGKVVVGDVYTDGALITPNAYRWTATDGIDLLPHVAGGTSSRAAATNSDGSVVVGTAYGSSFGGARAFRWTQAGGSANLGTIAGGEAGQSFASAVNADGSVVVGYVDRTGIGLLTEQSAFRWTQAGGMLTVEQWLRGHGYTIADGQTWRALAVNADGTIVMGMMQNGDTFVARTPADKVPDPVSPGGGEPAPQPGGQPGSQPGGGGLITLREFASSLGGTAALPASLTSSTDMLLHGAHGSPLRSLVPAGKVGMWTTGDWGRTEHGGQDGIAAVGEAGLSYRFNEQVQLNLAVGGGNMRQYLEYDGKSTARQIYVMPELLWNLPSTPLWLTASALYADGDLNVRRGYPNAGVDDRSSGKASLRTTAARLRLDWRDALAWERAALTPYLDYSYIRTRVGSYTEHGGGFPARWDARTDHANVARLGVDATVQVGGNVQLLGTVEASHRFESHNSGASGQVIGLMPFELDGASTQRNWLRFGAGVQAPVGPGTASLMLNTTTHSSMPSYWLAATYRLAF